jgi:predicted Zn finger-like uncharacterized protein
MYSQCPECQARFRVTAAALRAAHGTVRCGRCGSAFDALERLSDQIPPAEASQPSVIRDAAPAEEPAARVEPVPAEFHFTTEDLEKVFIDARDWHRQIAPATSGRDEPGAEESAGDAPLVVVEEPARVEDITLEGERISLDEHPPQDEIPPSLRVEQDDEAPEVELTAVEPEPPAPAMDAPEPAPHQEPRPPAPERWRDSQAAAETADETPTESTHTRLQTLAWSVGCLLLALLLSAQLVHHYRQELSRSPQAGPALRSIYERIGRPLEPHWDLGAFELLQWGRAQQPDAPGQLLVRASLRNRADFPQPHPLLRLELENRFGAPVAAREFEPEEYLKDPAQAGRLLDAGAVAEAELVIADPGQDAMGYRLDVCIRESASRLRCAQGPG